MARKKKAAKAEEVNEIILDGVPGADPISEEDAESFQVDLNFEDAVETEEVEFPKEQEIEETETSELTTTPEELQEKVEEETEAKGSEDGENPSEEVVATENEADSQPDVQQPVEEVAEVEQKAPMVPKSRLDEVLAKQKALQKQLEEMQKAKQEVQKEAPNYDFAAKEAEYQQFVLDGESEKAVALRNEIRQAEKDQFMFEVQQQMGQTVQQSQEQQALQVKATELEQKFPVFDINSAEHDPDLLKDALELRDAFMIQGYEGPDALEKAVNLTLLQQKPTLLQEKPVEASSEVKEVQQKQQKVKVEQKIQAAESQPPQMRGESAKSSDKIDIHKLSEKEFGALPAETLKRLRGDFS